MELIRKHIGTTRHVKGFGSVLIENDESKFQMYKNLGLDVFKKAKKKAPAPVKEEE